MIAHASEQGPAGPPDAAWINSNIWLGGILKTSGISSGGT
jgi:hypothetical protein